MPFGFFFFVVTGITTPIVPSDPSTWPKPKFSGGNAITVFLVILTGAFSLGQVIPNSTELLKVSLRINKTE